MSLNPGFHVITTVIVSICRRLVGDTLPMCRSRLPTVTIIWKPGLRYGISVLHLCHYFTVAKVEPAESTKVACSMISAVLLHTQKHMFDTKLKPTRFAFLGV